MKKSSLFLITICLLSAAAFTADSFALDPEAESQRLYLELMSPFCPGRALKDCPSGQAGELKDKILSDLKSGRSPDAIVDEMVGKYGEDILATPSTNSSTGALFWAAPLVFLILGGLIVGGFVRRTLKRSR